LERLNPSLVLVSCALVATMRRSTAALLLTTVLTALLPPQTAATILKCYCSDCPQEQSICYGEVCTRQTLYNFHTGAKVSERWRCLNDSFASCNISSSLLSYECCSSHDFCNNENCTTSHFEESTNRTNNYRCETGNFTGTSLTTNSSEETNCTTGSEDAELTPEINTSYPSFVPEGDRFQCHEAESTNPQNFNFTFCETSTTCFNSLRIRNDGSRIFRWGCSREDPAHSCAEENRNRKKKTCCRGWFCNKDLPTDWVKGNENETTPTVTTPTDATPTNSTRPLPAEISTDSPPTEEETPSNCTLAEEGGSSDIKPCAGPGSVIELTPEEFEVVPITTEIGDSWNFFCYCTTCPDSYIICGSHFGCATLYSYDISVTTGGPSIVTSHSCLSRDEFVSCGKTPGFVCCLSNFCNAPHSLNLTETPPTGSPTEPITAGETYPIEIPSVTEASLTEGSPTNQNTGIYIYLSNRLNKLRKP
jgi:hypothetical protein